MDNENYKNFFTKFGILSAFLAIIFGILVYSVVLSRKFWNKNLKVCIEKILDENDTGNWIVGNSVPIKNPSSVNAACFEATNRRQGSSYKVVILRVTTFYGPIPVVFTVDSDNNVEMIGFSSLHGRVAKTLHTNNYSKRFEYWENKIPDIIK